MDHEFAQPFEKPGDAREPSGAEWADVEDAVAIDPLTAEVLEELKKSPDERTWTQTLVMLGLSIFLFSMSGLLSYSLPDLLLLLGVLFFHELGHYAGMRLFNYQDVKMFFIPFFGAAVSGRTTSVAGYVEAIVILLGPLPGIVAGVILGVVCWFQDGALLRSAATTLLLINGFNLLPFMPLDGGRLLHLVVFSRQRHLEALFRIVTGLLLALAGLSLGAWVLMAVGVFMAIGFGYTFRVSTLSQKLRALKPPSKQMDLSGEIPPEDALPLVLAVREGFPQIKQAKQLVNAARQIWERMHVQPPGVLASLALLVVYAGALLIAPMALIVFHVPIPSVVSRIDAEGRPAKFEEVRVWGQLRDSTELGSDDEYNGRHVAFSPQTGELTVEGQFKDGLPEGKWTYYGPGQVVQGSQTFKDGKVVEQNGTVPQSPLVVD